MSACRACDGDGTVLHLSSVPRPSGCTAERWIAERLLCNVCDGTGYEILDTPVDDDAE
jgi:hypothetical protein